MDKATFWNLIAKRYAKAPISDQQTYEKKLGITREYLDRDSRMLEVGCGTGSTALLHAPFVKHILATDISKNMIAIAREKLADSGIDNVSFEQADLDSLVCRGDRFDAVLALNILHLVDDLDPALTGLVGLLEDGAVLISSTACLRGRIRLIRLLGRVLRPLGLFPSLNAFSESELLEAHRRAGLVIEVQWTPEDSPVIFIVARKQATHS